MHYASGVGVKYSSPWGFLAAAAASRTVFQNTPAAQGAFSDLLMTSYMSRAVAPSVRNAVKISRRYNESGAIAIAHLCGDCEFG